MSVAKQCLPKLWKKRKANEGYVKFVQFIQIKKITLATDRRDEGDFYKRETFMQPLFLLNENLRRVTSTSLQFYLSRRNNKPAVQSKRSEEARR